MEKKQADSKDSKVIKKSMQAYIEFMFRLIPAVVGEKNWKTNIWIDSDAARKTFSEYVTPGEEAWAIINVENAWVRYMYDDPGRKEGQEGEEDGPRTPKHGYLTAEEIQQVQDHQEAWSKGKTKKKKFPSKWTSDSKVGGWDADGRARFNELVEEIREDRKKWGEAFDELVDTIVSEEIQKKKPKRKKSSDEEEKKKREYVECVWEGSDDEEEKKKAKEKDKSSQPPAAGGSVTPEEMVDPGTSIVAT